MHSIVLGNVGPKVLRRAEADGLPGSLGGFGRLGRVVVRWPLLVIAFWIALAVALFLLLPPLAKIAGEPAERHEDGNEARQDDWRL